MTCTKQECLDCPYRVECGMDVKEERNERYIKKV